MDASMAMNTTPAAGWLRNRQFDLVFILGTTMLALASGWTVVANPHLFPLVLMLDIWLLGQHHVVSTFTRLAFSKADLERYRFYVFYLPPIVFAVSFLVGAGIGWWVLGTVYFYWQWFHYSRQSWGVAQMYRRRAEGRADDPETMTKLAFYLPPLWGILHHSWQSPDRFIGAELRTIPVSGDVIDLVGIAALLALSWWVVRRIAAWRRGELAPAHTLYVVSHHVVFFTGYILVESVTYGWLVLNVWHNLQYILFVWLHNNRRFREGIDPAMRSLSSLSQSGRMWRYMLVCLALSTFGYLLLREINVAIGDVGLPLLMLMYMTLNFHHYIVDGVIWKTRRPRLTPA
jgi:hypothetical protein